MKNKLDLDIEVLKKHFETTLAQCDDIRNISLNLISLGTYFYVGISYLDKINTSPEEIGDYIEIAVRDGIEQANKTAESMRDRAS